MPDASACSFPHSLKALVDGVRPIYGYLAAADRNGVRSRPISSPSVTATRIIVSAAGENPGEDVAAVDQTENRCGHAEQTAARRVPELDRLVPTHRGDAGAVWREQDEKDQRRIIELWNELCALGPFVASHRRRFRWRGNGRRHGQNPPHAPLEVPPTPFSPVSSTAPREASRASPREGRGSSARR